MVEREDSASSNEQIGVCEHCWRERILPAAMNRLESVNGTEKTKFCVKLMKRSDSVNFVRSRRCCS